MRNPAIIITVFLLALTACGLFGNSDDDNNSPRTIVFSAKDEGGTYQIYTMREDGSGVKKLTNGEFSSTNPAWSPEGSRIAYAHSTGSTAGDALWVMNTDGSDKQPLVTNPGTDSPQLGNNPTWSPHGSKVAFDRCVNCELGGTNSEIFVADLQNGAIDTLTSHPVEDSHPTWSPDGQRIAFTSNRDYFDADTLRFRKEIYLIDTNGTELQRLTTEGISRNPIWEPKKDMIGFGSNVSEELGLYQVEVQSGKILEIKEDFSNGFLLVPMAWSSDGQKLLILSRDQSTPEDFSMYIIDIKNGQSELVPFKSALYIGADWFTNN